MKQSKQLAFVCRVLRLKRGDSGSNLGPLRRQIGQNVSSSLLSCPLLAGILPMPCHAMPNQTATSGILEASGLEGNEWMRQEYHRPFDDRRRCLILVSQVLNCSNRRIDGAIHHRRVVDTKAFSSIHLGRSVDKKERRIKRTTCSLVPFICFLDKQLNFSNNNVLLLVPPVPMVDYWSSFYIHLLPRWVSNPFQSSRSCWDWLKLLLLLLLLLLLSVLDMTQAATPPTTNADPRMVRKGFSMGSPKATLVMHEKTSANALQVGTAKVKSDLANKT
jgi:hypothetical protein